MPDRPLVAGVDTSTQSCKVVVCDAATGEVVRTGRASHPDGTEVDPRHWWAAWQEASGDGILDGVAALAVGGQQHGMVLLDEHGEVVRDALLWNDTRSAHAADQLVAELGAQAWADATGLVPVAATTVSKLRWMADHEPEVLARARTCVLPHDWLTGRIRADGATAPDEWTTDGGDASGTGYWSAGSREYRPDLLRLATGGDLAVPRVAAPAEVVGTTASGLAVAAGTGDNMGAALGLGLQRGDVVVSLGTSGTAFARNSRASADPTGSVQSFADAEGGFLPLVCTLNAARVLTAGAAMLGTDHAGLDRLALAGAPGAQGLTLVPYLDGERTPNLPTATGSLHGLTRLNATPENLARAVVEGMLLNLAAAVDAVRAVGCPVERVLLIGGAAASTAVQDIAPDLFGVPVAVPSPGEYVAVGAARQAAWALAGGQRPPAWAVDVDVTVDPADVARGAETRARYDAIVAATHPTAGA
jgi:xylulokinase